jgi:hypothetical protein
MRIRTKVRTLFPVGASPLRNEQPEMAPLVFTKNTTAVHCALLLHASRHFSTLGDVTTTPMLSPTPAAVLSRHQENSPMPLDWGAAAELAAACCCGCWACSVESTLNALRVLMLQKQRQQSTRVGPS